jgi:hypothetical protein
MNSPQTPIESTSTAVQTAAQAADRRRSSREAIATKAWVSAEAGTRGANHQVIVNDLSLHGVGFKSETIFEKDSIHWIVLGAGGLRASSRMRIVSCREREDMDFDCGAEFF